MKSTYDKSISKLKKYIKIDETVLKILGNNIFCTYCNIAINAERKSNVVQHLKTKNHQKNSMNKTYAKESELLTIPKKISNVILEGFLGANIPLHKLRNTCLVKMFEDLNIVLPSETTLRNHIKHLYLQKEEELKKYFKNKKIYIMIDETSFLNRMFVNVLMGNFEAPEIYFLVECIELERNANHEIIVRIVDDVFKNYNDNRNNLMALISDSV